MVKPNNLRSTAMRPGCPISNLSMSNACSVLFCGAKGVRSNAMPPSRCKVIAIKFIRALPDGPVPFHYPAEPYEKDLELERREP